MKRNKTILGRLKTIGCKLDSIITTCSPPDSIYTSFLASTQTDDACNTTALPLDRTLYHDGDTVLPELGDTVYEDAAGTILFTTENFEEVFMGGDELNLDNWLKTDINGIRVFFACK